MLNLIWNKYRLHGPQFTRQAVFLCLSSTLLSLSACGGGGSSGGGTTPPPPTPPPAQVSKAFKTQASTSRFLGHATFGPNESLINSLTGTEVSDWIKGEFNKQPTEYLPRILQQIAALERREMLFAEALSSLYFDEAIAGNDQLRQRMVFALSEIIVVSSDSDLDDFPQSLAQYVDILSKNAFGNYRDILKEVTYTPAMAFYLTYLANEKGDPATGQMPDENYARELLQLFSIGLNELNLDGTQKTNGQGEAIETYDNNDITGLAKVFTGLSTQGSNFYDIQNDFTSLYKPLVVFADFHSDLEKSFLGTTIPANTPGAESIDQALDTIFNHPNVAPFVSRQLIQRFVTSHPQPAYIGRVSAAFESGRFTLPDSTSVGTGQRGDLRATIAAVLLDDQALQDPAATSAEFGKVREPIIRFVNWARAFNETTPDSTDEYFLHDSSAVGQHPFRPRSVFNFFRPGYVAPGTATGAAGLTAPELQIVNESSAISYINFINSFIYNFSPTVSEEEGGGVNADYARELSLANNPQALVDRLDLLLTGNTLRQDTKDRIIEVLEEMPITVDTDAEARISRVLVAVTMVMTAPGYLVQR